LLNSGNVHSVCHDSLFSNETNMNVKYFVDTTLEMIDNMIHFDERINFKKTQHDLITVGELLIDMISEDYSDHVDGGVYQKHFGGSPSNIVINTKRLGINSITASTVGDDGLGDFLTQHLQNVNVDTSNIQRDDDATSMVLINKSKSTPTPIFYRQADYHLQYNSKLGKGIQDSKIMHFTCWPISMEPARSTVEKCIKAAKANNLLIGFDPNYHPKLWKKNENGVEYIKSIMPYVDIVKPSLDDAERLFGEDDIENHIQQFLNVGAKLVILSLGKDGAVVSNGKETFRFPSLATEVTDTTGAGDAFWSGFYAALIKGNTVKEALQSGFAVSAYKLKYTGATVDLPKLEDIKNIYF